MENYKQQLINAIIVLRENYVYGIEDDEKLKAELGIDDKMWEEISRFL